MRQSDLHGDMQSTTEMSVPSPEKTMVSRNSKNGPKVHREPLLPVMAGSASGYMLERLENPVVLDKSENPSGADNQQERLSADWVVGFVDGEGCFFVGINRQPSMKLGWQVLPEFRVVQHQKDVAILEQLQRFFGFGLITTNHGDRKELRIRGAEQLNRVVGFFKAHPLRTVKRSSFESFAEVIAIMNRGEHLTEEGLQRIKDLTSRMNRGAQNPQRPYARSPVECTGG
jgi:hypothetical protein